MVGALSGDESWAKTYDFRIRGRLPTMMGHLPAESWSHIAGYLPPSALDATNSSSSAFQRMLIPSAAMNRHRALKEEYGSYTCGHGQPNSKLTLLAVNFFCAQS